MVTLPFERQATCVWLDKASAANLRELLMPVCTISTTTINLSLKLYEALLRMTLTETDAINVPLSLNEVMLINSLVKNKHWTTADAILLQTWQVAYEHQHGQAFRLTTRKGIEEVMDAVHQDRGEAEGEGLSAERWRA